MLPNLNIYTSYSNYIIQKYKCLNCIKCLIFYKVIENQKINNKRWDTLRKIVKNRDVNKKLWK